MKANPFFSHESDKSSSDASEFGITEIVLPQAKDAVQMLMPMLAHRSLHHNGRWFTWLNPGKLNKQILRTYGFNLNVLRRVDTVDKMGKNVAFDCLFETLVTGNSQTVVASPGKLTEKQLAKLDHAAKLGRCTGLLIRFRD